MGALRAGQLGCCLVVYIGGDPSGAAFSGLNSDLLTHLLPLTGTWTRRPHASP